MVGSSRRLCHLAKRRIHCRSIESTVCKSIALSHMFHRFHTLCAVLSLMQTQFWCCIALCHVSLLLQRARTYEYSTRRSPYPASVTSPPARSAIPRLPLVDLRTSRSTFDSSARQARFALPLEQCHQHRFRFGDPFNFQQFHGE